MAVKEMSDDVFETDGDIDESAIDDDGSSDWEDSTEESGKSSIDDKLSFPRVESRRNLTSRRSLITTMLRQNDRAAAPQSPASKSTSALQRSGFRCHSRPCLPSRDAPCWGIAQGSLHHVPCVYASVQPRRSV
jgi:hypothetical protein